MRESESNEIKATDQKLNDKTTSDSSYSQEEKENELFSIDDLFNAVRYGTSAHVSYILEKDKNLVNRFDSQGYSSVHWASKRGDVDILTQLYNSGANLDCPTSFESKMLPIHWAASEGKIPAVRFLLDHRQDINAQDANGCSPVVIATQYCQSACVVYLLKNGADLTMKDSNGDSALHWAAYKGYEELVGLLMHFLPHDLNTEDVFGQTPLHLAALRGNHEVVEYLISEYGADISKKDKNGLTPLELSIRKSQLKCEWVIRRLSSKNTIELVRKLGTQRLKERRVLGFVFFGSNEKEYGAWMWRVTFISNLFASYMSVSYALNEILSDLYVLHLINTVFQFMWWLSFLLCLWKNPSTVSDFSAEASSKKSSKFHPHSYDAALEIIGSDTPVESSHYPVVCHTCRVQRPLRSKHCKVARKCVNKFDHFCPFVYNTVGRDNYKFFVALLTIHPFAYSFFVITTVYYWSRVSFSAWYILFLAYSLLMCVMVLFLLQYHYRLLTINLTTNEDVNLMRYAYMKNEFNVIQNPFDRGSAWVNVMDGLFPSPKSYFNRDDVIRDIHSNNDGENDGQEGFFEEAKVRLLQ